MQEEQSSLSSRPAFLISGYLMNKLPPSQIQELESWIDQDPSNLAMFREILDERALEHSGQYFRKIEVEKSLLDFKNRLGYKAEHKSIKVRFLSFSKYIAAASILLIAGSTFFFIKISKPIKSDQIKPGRETATLTLSDGKQLKLSDLSAGVLGTESGITIVRSSDGQLIYKINGAHMDPGKTNVLSTGRGETYHLQLEDGTGVWLNAMSKLTFSPALIKNGKRLVSLEGEGYFEVAKDKLHPFIVRTSQQHHQQEVQVLGTKFNIDSYPGQGITTTTLVEGSVQIYTDKLEKIIRPDEQAVNSGGDIFVSAVTAADFVFWKDGYFRFNDEKLSSIMAKIERWYDVEVQISDELGNRQFSGKISRTRNITDILKLMEETNRLRFKIEGRRVIVIDK